MYYGKAPKRAALAVVARTSCADPCLCLVYSETSGQVSISFIPLELVYGQVQGVMQVPCQPGKLRNEPTTSISEPAMRNACVRL